jgi:KDO2-lipid IV(A) lauroyltransferase
MKFEIKTTGLIDCPPTGDKEGDVRAILERLNAELERVIREAPEQYLWAHRRWRD